MLVTGLQCHNYIFDANNKALDVDVLILNNIASILHTWEAYCMY